MLRCRVAAASLPRRCRVPALASLATHRTVAPIFASRQSSKVPWSSALLMKTNSALVILRTSLIQSIAMENFAVLWGWLGLMASQGSSAKVSSARVSSSRVRCVWQHVTIPTRCVPKHDGPVRHGVLTRRLLAHLLGMVASGNRGARRGACCEQLIIHINKTIDVRDRHVNAVHNPQKHSVNRRLSDAAAAQVWDCEAERVEGLEEAEEEGG